MKVRSLTLHGFKSFADRIHIDFREGITAIVGPNGCGKSNISDALRWVLGEQRPSAIRGSRMEEAIFQGTSGRKPVHRAEVQLALSNEDGLLSVPHAEVVIGRTVLRGGESVYTLNERAVRLRDIQDLCRDTGLGANAYSIIESRMIDAILSDRAEERRSLFEEAAEVGRYKDRRRTALRRLEQAEHDLRRLEDVIGEVESKVRSLARQRGRARRWQELRERRLVLEVAVADARLAAIEDRMREVDEALAEARRVRPEAESSLGVEETEVEALRLDLVERERNRTAAASRLEEVRGRLEALERERLLTEERIATARARLDGLAAERDEMAAGRRRIAEEREEAAAAATEAEAALRSLREEEAGLDERVGRLRARRSELAALEAEARAELDRLIAGIGSAGAEAEALRERQHERQRELERRRAERDELRAGADRYAEDLAAHEARTAAAAQERAELEARLEAAREAERTGRDGEREARERHAALAGELSAARERAAALAALLDSGRDLPSVVTALLEDPAASPGTHGVLADCVRVPAADVAAVEAHLGSFLHAVVVDDWRTVERVRAWLQARGEGEGVVLLPLDPGPVARAGKGGLLARVEARGAGAPWVRALLAGVESRAEGFGPATGPWVAPDGSGQDAAGAVRIGRPAGGRGALRRRAELDELRRRLDDLERRVEEAQGEVEAESARTRRLAAEAAAADRALEEASVRLRAAVEARDDAAAGLERARRLSAELDGRIVELEEMLGRGGPEQEAGSERLAELRTERERVEASLSDCRAELATATGDWEAGSAALQESRLRIARAEAEAAAAAERTRRLAERDEELAERERRLAAEKAEREAAIEAGHAALAASEESLERLFGERRALADEVARATEGLAERRDEVERRETALRALRQRERQTADRLHELELEATRLHGARAAIRERIEAEWEEELESLRARVERPAEGSPEDWRTELEEVRESLASLGPVNLLAAAEYDEEKERLDFLQGQREDLVSARDDLLGSIQRINEAASRSFEQVFEQVRENFQRIFVTLFEGGEADVWLEDPADPLDSPIEISASPRGKRTQRIHLLSGGERALTALALLFAIYLAKPSPFCVMDEVDAPLDESNIGRFTAMLERFKESTQFIVITHNPRTIEAADHIYGVTMQEPGVSTLVAMDIRDLPRGQVA
ncbi:MAG: chromosome segregation protein SMC [Gemmatimonadota bacterium]|nr:chromosome segregation protein SMC [Gemmatimonadota bacterium]